MDHMHGGQSHDQALGHGMIVFGFGTVYFSHLAMFSEAHGFQVVMEVTLEDHGSDPARAYADDRKRHPESPFRSLRPTPFHMSELLPKPGASAKLKAIAGDLFRGQYEFQSEEELEANLVAPKVTARVKNIIVGRRLVPLQARPPRLEYVLVGKPDELYLVHLIHRPPDFDQILAVTATGSKFTSEELARGVTVGIPDTQDAAENRLQEDTKVEGEALLGDKATAVELQVGKEAYFADADFQE